MGLNVGRSVLKAQKLLKITLQYSDERVQSVQVRGDFFMHPEENLELLEKKLEGCPLEREELEARANEFLQTAQVFGFDQKSLAEAILQAAGKSKPPTA